jgi:hypothetical protein
VQPPPLTVHDSFRGVWRQSMARLCQVVRAPRFVSFRSPSIVMPACPCTTGGRLHAVLPPPSGLTHAEDCDVLALDDEDDPLALVPLAAKRARV